MKKRQLSKEERILWDNFTYSIKKSAKRDRLIYIKNDLASFFMSQKQTNKNNFKQMSNIKKIVLNENSLFIQHYKLFKAHKNQLDNKNGSFMAIGQKQPGLDKNTWKKFQNGELKSQWRLDLHGFTAHHAFLALENFILNAYRQQIRCIEIITGVGNLSQGGGILKRELPHWLNRPYIHSMILATTYVSATNNGAVRILLKKRR